MWGPKRYSRVVEAEIEARDLGDKGFQEEMGARLLEK